MSNDMLTSGYTLLSDGTLIPRGKSIIQPYETGKDFVSKADKLYKDNLKEILEHGTSTEGQKVRPKYKDGTPAHTIYVNQVVEKYDISQGELPITTLRPIAWKSAIKEMMVIYQDQLNTQEAFENKGITWWKPWMNEEGNIGRAYPYNLESHRDNEQVREVVKIKKRIVDEQFKELEHIKVDDVKEYKEEDVLCEKYILVDRKVKERLYLLQNIETGEKQWVGYSLYTKIKKGNFTTENHDPFLYNRTFYGIGYRGNLNNVFNLSEYEINILKRKWVNMLKRVATYSQYENIFVHQEWHSLENFLKDVFYLPQFNLARADKFEGWDLDKDYYGSNCYSKATCVFLKKSENIMYSDNNNVCILEHPDGTEERFISLTEASRKYGLSYGNLYSTTIGKRNHTNGFKAKIVECEEGYVYRLELSRNQVNNLLQELKEEPYTRRHIISFWNWQNIDKKELVECAYETVWNVRGEYLDMTLHQR